MESLEETQWDVTISGTGIAQSLLALYVRFLLRFDIWLISRQTELFLGQVKRYFMLIKIHIMVAQKPP